MPSFVTVTNGVTAQAQDVNQVIAALNGTAGSGIPISLTALNDSVNFALALKNADPTNSRALQVLRANNNVLIQADANGVIVSPDGGATTGQVLTVSATQTLTNKTLTNPVIGGAGAVAAGTLGFSGTNLQVGDGTANRAVNVGPWSTWALIVTQPGSLTVTVNAARYDVSGKRVTVFLLVTIGQVGTTGNDIVVTSPVVPLNVGAASCVGSFQYRGATFRAGSVIATATNTFKLQVDNNVGFLGTTPALALAVGDTISLTATYEAA